MEPPYQRGVSPARDRVRSGERRHPALRLTIGPRHGGRASRSDGQRSASGPDIGPSGLRRRQVRRSPVAESTDRCDAARGDRRCRACPRLVAWREEVAAEQAGGVPRRRYWGRPVPGFGDPAARVLVVGLAPAAHGANRTGRMFTGDRSGEWLYRALFRAGFANQPDEHRRDDGLRLTGVHHLAGSVRAACQQADPRRARPLPPVHRARARAARRRARCFVALGHFAYQAIAALVGLRPRPPFGHGARSACPTAARLASPRC